MGLFSKLKQNFNHGGVKVSLQAPYSVSMQDAFLPVAVTVTASAAPQTVNKVTAEIIATTQNQSFSTTNDIDTQPTSTTRTIARADNVQPFQLQPGQSQLVNLQIVMNAGAAMGADPSASAGVAQFAQFAQKLQSIGEALSHDSYSYSLHVKADVDGISLDPSDSQQLQILKPGQVGFAVPGVDARVNL